MSQGEFEKFLDACERELVKPKFVLEGMRNLVAKAKADFKPFCPVNQDCAHCWLDIDCPIEKWFGPIESESRVRGPEEAER